MDTYYKFFDGVEIEVCLKAEADAEIDGYKKEIEALREKLKPIGTLEDDLSSSNEEIMSLGEELRQQNDEMKFAVDAMRVQLNDKKTAWMRDVIKGCAIHHGMLLAQENLDRLSKMYDKENDDGKTTET